MRAREEQVQPRALALLDRARRGPGSPREAEPTPAPEPPGAGAPPPVVAVPRTLEGAHTLVSWQALGGLLLVLAVVATVFGGRVLLARTEARPLIVPAATSSTPGGTPSSAARTPAAPPGASPAGTTPAIVVIDVAGAVRSPGVQRLPTGSRVVDALARAGGTTPDADLTGVNRARVLADGELLRVPRQGEAPVAAAPAPGTQPGSSAAGGGTGTGGTGTGGTGAAPGGLVDLNTADAAALDTLPGVGPAIAGRILDWRAEHGRFTSVDELGEVSGIGDKLLERLRPLVRV